MRNNALLVHAGSVKHSTEYLLFQYEVWRLHAYLLRKACISVSTMAGDEENFETNFFSCVHEHVMTSTPLLVGLFGHGNKRGFQASKEYFIKYETLASALSYSEVPVLVLLDACHSFQLARVCKKAGVNPEMVGVIASCSANKTCYIGEFVSKLIDRWSKGKAYPQTLVDPIVTQDIYTEKDIALLRGPSRHKVKHAKYQTVRWGARHDYLFYPQTK